jgi:hypothetical protein
VSKRRADRFRGERVESRPQEGSVADCGQMTKRRLLFYFLLSTFSCSMRKAAPRAALLITERVGFEPTELIKVHWFSKPARSATPAPLQPVLPARKGGDKEGMLPSKRDPCKWTLGGRGARIQTVQARGPEMAETEKVVILSNTAGGGTVTALKGCRKLRQGLPQTGRSCVIPSGWMTCLPIACQWAM